MEYAPVVLPCSGAQATFARPMLEEMDRAIFA